MVRSTDFDSSNSYLNGYPKYVEAEASLSGDTFEYIVPLEFFNNAMGGQYNVDPLSFEIKIGDYNNQNLLDNLTIIDNTIELQEGHYFNADNSDATITFQIDNYSSLGSQYLNLKLKDYSNPNGQQPEFFVELPQIFDSSNSYLNGYPKYVEAEASLSGDTFEYTVPLEFFNNAMGGQYNVDPLSFEIEIGDYNNQKSFR